MCSERSESTALSPAYAELATARLHEKLTIQIRLKSASVDATDIPDLDKSQRYNVAATLLSPFSSRSIGLINGGWLPSILGATDPETLILVDRNVIVQITGRFSGGVKRGREPDFLDFFADLRVRINPLLFVMEGNGRAEPGWSLGQSQLSEVIEKLKAALPNADIVASADTLIGAMGLIADSRPLFERKQQFLLRLAPMLRSPVSGRKRHACWNEVITVAHECRIPLNLVLVLAVLSTVSIPNGRSPARRLLKFKPEYGVEDAYNALVDLRALELLIGFFAMYPGHPIQLCTADRDLALFWVGARASNYRRIGDAFAFDMSPVPELLPELELRRWLELVEDS